MLLLSDQSVMAELAFATVSLLPILNTLVGDIRFVMLAKDFGSSLHANMVLLNNSAMRVSRFGATFGLTGQAADTTKIQKLIPNKGDRVAVQDTLSSINGLMNQARRKSKDYGECK